LIIRIPRLALLAGILLLTGILGCFAQATAPAAKEPNHAATRDRIARYVRERFNIPDNVKLTVGPFRDSPFSEFLETILTLDDGKQPRTQRFYVTKDGRFLVDGNVYTLGADPKREISRAISLEDQPTQGPANAPITFVEYADLQCPMCARLHEMLEKDVVPKYGDKIRVVFKEFPLPTIHDWAVPGAIASQCAYQIAPDQFVAFRTLVYQNQNTFTGDNARDMLLHYGAQVGIDNQKLASCLDSKASLPRVEASSREGQELGIASTPTSFVNGRVVVGAPDPPALYKILDEALDKAK